MFRKERMLASALALTSLLAAACAQESAATPVPLGEKELEALFDCKVEGLETPPRKTGYVYKSELTPAIAFLSQSPTVMLFHRIQDYGLSGPTACAYVSGGQVRVAGRGEVPTRSRLPN